MNNNNAQHEEIPLENLSREQFLALSLETTQQMGWVLGNIIQNGFVAYTCKGLFANNAEIRLQIKEDLAQLQSKSVGNDFVNVKENKRNIREFIEIFQILKRELIIEELIPARKTQPGF